MIRVNSKIKLLLCSTGICILTLTPTGVQTSELNEKVWGMILHEARRLHQNTRMDERTKPSVLDGVYTKIQAERGRRSYLKECSSCHSKDLRGGETGLPLLGRSFRAAWSDKTLGDLFENIRTTMPEESPGRLSDKIYINILSYILESNRFPPGPEALEADLVQLNEIRLDDHLAQ
mgnify:CR=1 FL=1